MTDITEQAEEILNTPLAFVDAFSAKETIRALLAEKKELENLMMGLELAATKGDAKLNELTDKLASAEKVIDDIEAISLNETMTPVPTSYALNDIDEVIAKHKQGE